MKRELKSSYVGIKKLSYRWPVKILIISPSFFPIVGGTEIVIFEISKRLVKKGHDVTILTPKYPEFKNSKTCEKIDSVKVYRFPISSCMYKFSALPRYIDMQMRAFRKIIELDRNEHFDIFHQFHLFALGGAVVLAKNILRKLLVTTLAGWDTYDPIHPVPNFFHSYLARVMNESDVVTSPCEELVKHAKEQGCRKRIKIIPHGVDITRFNPCIDGSMVRKNLEIKDDETMVLSVQRLVRKKGVDWLINAILEVIKKSARNVRFIIVGEGPEKNELIELARKLKVSNSVDFTGFIASEEIARYYSASDILVLYSLYEQFGITLLEAMACGKPVISTRVGAIPEVVDHGKTGLLVPPKNPEALADAIMKLVKDEELRIRMGMEGRKKVEREYDWDVIVDNYLKLYEDMNDRLEG